MRIFFASDFHGSDICFKKFLNARSFYDADVLLLGGDLCAKSVAFINQREDGWEVILQNRVVHFSNNSDFENFKARILNAGFLIRTDIDASESQSGFPNFDAQIRSRLQEWAVLAERTVPCKPIYFVPGNDDPLYLDDIFGPPFINVHAKHLMLDAQTAIIGLGGSTFTPWNTEREYSESQLESFLTEAYNPELASSGLIFLSHCPPYGCGLDLAPALRDDLSYDLHLGAPHLVPVGSHAVRSAIAKFRPSLGLFGHIHEGRGFTKLDGTLCINPGSAFWTGRLNGCIVDIINGKVANFQLTEG
jgi:uncharacterized protein